MKKKAKRKLRKYSFETITKVLADVANIGVTYAAKKWHIPISTVGTWVSEYPEEFEKIKNEVRDVFVEKAAEVINIYLEHLKDPEVVAKTSARDSAIIIGTLRDKLALAQGEPSERVEVNDGGVEGVLWARAQEDTTKESKE